MKQVTVYIADNKYLHFVELVKSLDYVKKVEAPRSPSKQKVLQGIADALEDVKLIKAGKKKAKSLTSFLNEL